tara:strand:- start:31686 stop:32597 length:912 start_codon:yes stop_codon:yes gene_type:complete
MTNKTLNSFRIGTRASPLALWQAEQVLKKIEKGKLIKIKTTGDKILSKPLSKIGGKGLFTKELDEAILNKHIDMAVHSLKDVPTIISKKFNLSYILPRGSHADILISRNNSKNIFSLPNDIKIGTSSPRRLAQIKKIRPDIEVVPIRGNIHTRLKKIKEKKVDGIILALSAIERLNIDLKYSILKYSDFLPSAGQGIICITYLKENNLVKNFLNPYININVNQQAIAERAVLEKLNGNCNSAIAVNSIIKDNKIFIYSAVYSHNKNLYIKDSINGDIKNSFLLGQRLGNKLIKLGALKILSYD